MFGEVPVPGGYQEGYYSARRPFPGNAMTVGYKDDGNYKSDSNGDFQNRDNSNKRDYLYYLAIGNTKLKVSRDNNSVFKTTPSCHNVCV